MSDSSHRDGKQPGAKRRIPGLLPVGDEFSARLAARAGVLVAISIVTGCALTVYMMLSAARAATDDGFLMGDQQKLRVASLCALAVIAALVGLAVWFVKSRWASGLLLAWVLLNIVLNALAGRIPLFSFVLLLISYESLRGAIRWAPYRPPPPQRELDPEGDPAFY